METTEETKKTKKKKKEEEEKKEKRKEITAQNIVGKLIIPNYEHLYSGDDRNCTRYGPGTTSFSGTVE